MKRAGTLRVAKRPLVLFAAGLLMFGLWVLVAYASNPTHFAWVSQPVGVAATPERILVVTPYTGNPRYVVQIDPSGNVTPFATLPDRVPAGTYEDYIAVSPGLGLWQPGYVYVSQGPTILKISPDGATVTPFVHVDSWLSGHTDMVFDEVGTFGYDLVVVSGDEVWRVTPTGMATMVAHIDHMLEGPDVVPTTLGPLGGQIWAATHEDTVVAIAPNGTVTHVVGWFEAERVHSVPANMCTLGDTGYSFFAAKYSETAGEIIKYPMSDFAGAAGKAIVASEWGAGIGLIDWNGTEYTVTQFCPAPYQHEGSDFVTCTVPNDVPFDVKPTSCPNPVNVVKEGVIPFAILGTATFDVHQVVPESVRVEGVAPLRWEYGDVTTPVEPYTGKTNCTTDCTTLGPDGYVDLTLKLDAQTFVHALGMVTDRECRVVHMTATLTDGRTVRGEDVIVVIDNR